MRTTVTPTFNFNQNYRLKQAGNLVELFQTSLSKNKKAIIKKLDKDTYLKLDTGEVCEYTHSVTKKDNKESVRQSLSRLKDIINANVTNPLNCIWFTATYAENMTDCKRLYRDCDLFLKNFFYRYVKNDKNFRYIVCPEPQCRGAWHIHTLFIFSDKAPFIPNDDLEKLWGHGFTKTKSLNNIDNIGVYLTAYLGDMELSECVENGLYTSDCVMSKSVDNKHYVKGGRLSLYPIGMRICRCSRNCKKAIVKDMADNNLVMYLFRNFPCKFQKSYNITLDNIEFTNSYYTFIIPQKKQSDLFEKCANSFAIEIEQINDIDELIDYDGWLPDFNAPIQLDIEDFISG